ncbi:MAG TPA: CotH kinase family protein [Polyangiaceae bacterium]|nr:CotH kinase family protein [Polyangiaceae bacterium]
MKHFRSCLLVVGLIVSAGCSSDSNARSSTSNEPEPMRTEPAITIDDNELPSSLPTLEITIDDTALQSLDRDPWHAADVAGQFTDETGTRFSVQLNYRGAYALQNLIQGGKPGERNWKVKFAKDQPYLGRREWNFNREPHLRQKLSYDLMKFAGVRVPSAQHVLLRVNGQDFGLYLRFEDPDNKAWLKEVFGSAAGDLYKAATDFPNETKYFALLTKLGAADSDYYLHYNKKLNNDGALAGDYSQLRDFIDGLNDTSDDRLDAWFSDNFDTEKFIDYLVVSNFVSNWDSYPQRPKNYWLYASPVTGRWIFLPWDMDATFQSGQNGLHEMGDHASIFHEFDHFEGRDPNTLEGSERPLVRRLMAIERYRQRYIDRYRELSASILSPDYLSKRIDRLLEQLSSVAPSDEAERVKQDSDQIKAFVRAKSDSTNAELANALP